MHSLQGFSDAATPVFADLDRAAPVADQATRALTPFTAASTVSLKSLGATGEVAGPKIARRRPDRPQGPQPGKTGVVPTTELAKFLVSTKKTNGFDGLVDLIYNSAAATNEFDQYGHFLRTLVA